MTESLEAEEPLLFATVEDLRQRWKDMPEGTDEDAMVALEDASQFIVDVAPRALEASANTLKRITCDVVKRSMHVSADAVGVSQMQQGAGPYQQSRSFANPHGDFYLTKQEKNRLKVNQQRTGSADLLENSREAHQEYDDAW